MDYEKPVIEDYGTLLELTAGGGAVGSEDGGGAGKSVVAGVDGIGTVSVVILPGS